MSGSRSSRRCSPNPIGPCRRNDRYAPLINSSRYSESACSRLFAEASIGAFSTQSGMTAGIWCVPATDWKTSHESKRLLGASAPCIVSTGSWTRSSSDQLTTSTPTVLDRTDHRHCRILLPSGEMDIHHPPPRQLGRRCYTLSARDRSLDETAYGRADPVAVHGGGPFGPRHPGFRNHCGMPERTCHHRASCNAAPRSTQHSYVASGPGRSHTR